MSNELLAFYPTGNTLYALLFNDVGQVWNGAAFEVLADANWLTYDIAMTELGTSPGVYAGDMPGAVAGAYSFDIRLQAGGSPATSDSSIGNGAIQWDGSAELSLYDIYAAIVAGGSIGTIEFTYTVDDGVDPVEGADIWISTDLAGTNVIWSGTTDALGVAVSRVGAVKPFLDPGTYYFWVQKTGYSPPSYPDTEVVS